MGRGRRGRAPSGSPDPSGYSLSHAGKTVLWKSDLPLLWDPTVPLQVQTHPGRPYKLPLDLPWKVLDAGLQASMPGPGLFFLSGQACPSFTYQDQALAYSLSPIS